ncbi:polysaccharide pyruvyl transferase family protein [Salinimicrobium soli]|uniref:polysaccharide pyruvyl transferase family protein n=1 Tax=Salinimicrobium soli TaxID=1254399 RepID=UPI003AAB260A
MSEKNIFINNIKNQQKLLYGCLDRLLIKGTKVALLDFPNHNNVGDNAIWLGEKAALKKMGVNVVYQCDIYGFSEKALRKRLGKEGVVLLHGGGNLGSVWPEHQMFRERIIQLFPDKKIIQLPQSVHFDDDTQKARFGQIGRAHKDLHILMRDHASLRTLKELNLNVELCPDMALAMGPVAQSERPVVDVVWLSRTDHESTGEKSESFSFKTEKLDWLTGEPGRFYSKFSPKFTVRIRRIVQSVFRNSELIRDHFWSINAASFDLLAKRRFNRGTRILCRGKVVLTDRLHGHIVSTLIGKPQVLLDNHYRKVGNYIDCFESEQEAIFYVGNDKSNIGAKVSKALDIIEKNNKND